MKLVIGFVILAISFNTFALSVSGTTADSLFSQVGRWKLESEQIKADYQEFTLTGIMPKFLTSKVEAMQTMDNSLDEASALEIVVSRANEL